MLGELLRIGDTVTVKIAQENLDWGYGRDIHGKTATVLSFGTIDYGYVHNYGKLPGIYENKSWVNVEVDGKEHHVSSCFLVCEASGDREYVEGVRLRDLPETKFWPGDTVQFVGDEDWLVEEGPVVVRSIDYRWIGKTCNDNVTPMPINNLQLNTGGTCAVRCDQLELIERGNVFKYYNDLPLEFEDLREEAEFYASLGHTEEVRNPATSLFSWPDARRNGKHFPEEALQAIRDGIGHGIKAGHDFFGNKMRVSVYRFKDEELGKRVAEATLKGFEL